MECFKTKKRETSSLYIHIYLVKATTAENKPAPSQK